ncbi:MAG: protease HtpX [Gammaproteobacteria bacterium]
MTRILLFLTTNFAVVLVLGLVLNLLGLNQQGSGSLPFLIMAAVFGMGGAFISLLLSKKMALRATGAKIIETPTNELESWLIATVHRQAEQAGIGKPDVAIFSSSAPNAFATGANKNAALVAVSSGLMNNMTRDEVEAVLGHEVSHVANGDMITLSLIQGVVNTFVMVFASIVASALSRGDGRSRGMGYYFAYSIAQAVFGFLASIVVMWFSRYREFRADEGGASLSSTPKMIAALERLQSTQAAELPASMAAFGISAGGIKQGLKSLLTTHPPLADRIAALRAQMS